MNRIATLLLVTACLLPALLVAGPIPGQIDTFQDGTTNGWFAGGLGLGATPPVPPHVVFGGGPAGAGDNYLLITSGGGSGPGSKLVALNDAQWTGDYLSSSVHAIQMDLRNFGNTALSIRLLFEDPMFGPPADEIISTVPFNLPANSGWVHALFRITPADLSALDGSVNAALANTTLLRIVHAPTVGDAEPVVGLLGVDNISFSTPEPATFGMAGLALAVALFARRKART